MTGEAAGGPHAGLAIPNLDPSLRQEFVTPQQAVAIARWMGFGDRNAYVEGGVFVWKGDPGTPSPCGQTRITGTGRSC